MKIKYSIRPALFEDIESILKLNQDTWDVSYKDYIPHHILKERHKTLDKRIKRWQENWKREQIGFIAEFDGKIIGEITGGLNSQTSDCDCILCSLYIHPNYQKCGIGKSLFLAFIDEMKKHHRHKIEIHTMYKGIPDKNGIAKLGPSIGFYQKMGCTLTEIYDTHPLGMTSVLMIKEL